MKIYLLFKLILCLIFNIFWLTYGQNITIWEDHDIARSQSWLTIRMFHNSEVNRGLLKSILNAMKGQKFLPTCAMVGCATNATQCVAYGGTEMYNKMSVGHYTQAFFKSVLTLDKTFLSLNCKGALVPCCFHRTDGKPETSFFQSFPFKFPSFPSLPSFSSLPLPSRQGFIRLLHSIRPGMPPIKVYILSNICMGIGDGFGTIHCNNDEKEDKNSNTSSLPSSST